MQDAQPLELEVSKASPQPAREYSGDFSLIHRYISTSSHSSYIFQYCAKMLQRLSKRGKVNKLHDSSRPVSSDDGSGEARQMPNDAQLLTPPTSLPKRSRSTGSFNFRKMFGRPKTPELGSTAQPQSSPEAIPISTTCRSTTPGESVIANTLYVYSWLNI